MKKTAFIYIGLFTLIVGLLAFIAWEQSQDQEKQVFVELESMYNDFEMKKELEAKLTNVQQMRKTILDSLVLELNSMSYQLQTGKDAKKLQVFEIRRREYLEKKQSFEGENQTMQETYASQIESQLSQYIRDFGKEQGYTYIFSYNGALGHLLYGQDTKNITKEVSAYVNQRYHGEKK